MFKSLILIVYFLQIDLKLANKILRFLVLHPSIPQIFIFGLQIHAELA